MCEKLFSILFRAVIISKLLGGASRQLPTDNTWRLFSAAAYMYVRSRLCPPELSDLTELVEAADDKLFQFTLKDNHIQSTVFISEI